MYDYGYSYGYGLIGGNTYNPLINYNWSTTTTSGLRYLKDVGSTPAYNASMYFGRGAYFNGVDQTITVPINATIQTSLKRVNGVIIINETSQILTNYVISGLGVHKDYYLFTRLLTTAEKDSYTNTPELFYAMAQADSTCVLNMPMCETDNYARNMKSYTTESKLSEDFSTTVTSFKTISSTYSITNGLMSITTLEATGGTYAFLDTIVGEQYLVRGNVVSTTGNYMIRVGNGSIPNAGIYTTEDKSVPSAYSFTFIAQSTTSYVYLRNLNPNTTVYDYVYVDRVTGLYPITNYTSSVRDNAKNLQYGLQTCKFVRDSLGVIQSGSDYLECDGVGYADTGLMLDASVLGKSFSFEIIDKVTKTLYEGDGIYNVCGWQSEQFKWLGNTAAKSISLGVFNHRVAIYNAENNTLQVFVNKVGDSIINCTVSTTTSASYPIGGIFFGGSILEVRSRLNPYRIFKVHNKVLTQEEITKNYNEYVAKGLLS